MAKTQAKGFAIADGSIQRDDLNTTTAGQAVVRKIGDEAGTGIKIKSSSGVDKGTGDVILELDTAYMDEHYGTGSYGGWTMQGSKDPLTGNTLYNHWVIEDARGICPVGWHVPTQAEMLDLSTALGGDSVAGGHLKAAGLVYWDAPNTGADNSSGFGARAVGYRDDAGTFWSAKQQNAMWTSTPSSLGNYYCSFMIYNGAFWYPDGGTLNRNYGLQIRLIKDNSTDPGTMTDYDGHVYDTIKIGSQVWMKQDLIVTHFNNGDVIPVVSNQSSWALLTTPGTCFYANTDTAGYSSVPVASNAVVQFVNTGTLSFKIEVVGGVIQITGLSVNTPGATGATGPTGNYTSFLFAKNTSSTAAPSLTVTDTNPAGWSATPPATSSGEFLWMTCTLKTAAGALVANWNAAVRIKGDLGPQGPKGDTGTGATGAAGPTGNYTSFLFAKNTSETAAPSLTVTDVNPGGWTSAPPATNTGEYLWMTCTLKTAAGALVANWNAAVRIKGDIGPQGLKGDAGIGSVYTIYTINSNTQAAVSSLYILTASLTLTLPASPTASDVIPISNQSGTLTCVLARNGNKIMGLSEDLTIDRLNVGFKLIYTNSTFGWVII